MSYKVFKHSTFLLILCGMFLLSCIQQPSSGRKKKSLDAVTTSTEETEADPSPVYIESGGNYFQKGVDKSYTTLSVYKSYTDYIYLRGEEVHNFIGNVDTTNPFCLISYFPSAADNFKVFVMTLLPNRVSGTGEYYYLIDPVNRPGPNQAQCQTAAITNTINTLYPGASISYTLAETCPTCNNSQQLSASVQMFSTGGTFISDVHLTSLNLQLLNAGYEPVPGGTSCEMDSECKALDKDCCLDNQCVKDGAIRPGAESTVGSAAYAQAMSEYENNPESFVNYPDVFFVCEQDIEPEPTITTPMDPELAALLVFQEKQELYNCTSPQEGEMGICTLTIENASELGATPVYTNSDDRNFNSTYTGTPGALLNHSITEIVYGGVTIYQADTITGELATPQYNGSSITIENQNDLAFATPTPGSLAASTKLTFPSFTPSADAPNDSLKIRYKIDASCEKLTDRVAQCSKYYIQGQNSHVAGTSHGRVDDHAVPTTAGFSRVEFKIPYYADLNRTVNVYVDGDKYIKNTDWTLGPVPSPNMGTPGYIRFAGTPEYTIADTQEVEIQYFVDIDAHPDFFNSKLAALNRIDELCQCGGPDCKLRPKTVVTNGTPTVTDYDCVYPEPDQPTAPLNETVNVSGKSIPHPFFDANGTLKATPSYIDVQEGVPFTYYEGQHKYARPNTGYPGATPTAAAFNEIYGSIDGENPTSADPPTVIEVVKGRSYSIVANSGSYSPCDVGCGIDYYPDAMLSNFPADSVALRAGGYRPEPFSTSRVTSGTESIFRADDLLFGRACFLPATMIPGAHKEEDNVPTQRRNRLAAQHFLFANGYQRDWFGFDYGALIGSFDGVWWFAVGNERKIEATSDKLFLAVNAYFGDLATATNFSVTVSDNSGIPGAGANIDSDFNNDGAECQRFHQCESDQDCVTQLGWDYSCETISNITSNFPEFDKNGKEVAHTSDSDKLVSKMQNLTGGLKRCVYRGRGAACKQNYSSEAEPGLHACSMNNYCESVTATDKFNTKITRFTDVLQYNAAHSVDLQTFGLGANVLGRPYQYNGTEDVSDTIENSLNANGVSSICIPGRNISATPDYITQHSSAPSIANGDQFSGIGVTSSGTTANGSALSACPAFDEDGNFLHTSSLIDVETTDLDDDLIKGAVGSQNISTTSLEIFSNAAMIPTEMEEILSEYTPGDLGTNQVFAQKNRCLRAPGAVCHTDEDCAISPFMAETVSFLDPDDSSAKAVMNEWEIKFWKEDLVCSQATPKILINGSYNPDYDLKNNRCCRENGKSLSIRTHTLEATPIAPTSLPGVDIDYDNSSRYSRISTAYDKLLNDSANYSALTVNWGDGTPLPWESTIKNQNETLGYIAQNTCCNSHWVRNFHESNGGGNSWSASKMQNNFKESLRCLNWVQCTAGTDCGGSDSSTYDGTAWTCPNPAEYCAIKNISPSTGEEIVDFLGEFELLGIPQVMVHTKAHEYTQCEVSPDDQTVSGAGTPIPTTIVATATPDYIDSDDVEYFSAGESANFDISDTGLKMVFSADEFTCCIPAGSAVETGSEDQCCTGHASLNPTNNQYSCSLPDYTDVTVYLNKYVSSQARDLREDLFDKRTGFIKDPANVGPIICQQALCASGAYAQGIALSKLKVPGDETTSGEIRLTNRFIYTNDADIHDSGKEADYFDNGLRWNTHVYCIPAQVAVEVQAAAGSGLGNINYGSITQCP